ncbi:hypothetical protein CO669_28875 [Bradyrhizobium sp. Y36]|nr:hypothetical protein CO669_28875 [Bradyrhizobium sp. Y36]
MSPNASSGMRAFSSEVDAGSRQENASKQQSRAPFRFHRNGKGSRAGATIFETNFPNENRAPSTVHGVVFALFAWGL